MGSWHQKISLGLTAAEQRELQARMEKKQMKMFMGVSLIYLFFFLKKKFT